MYESFLKGGFTSRQPHEVLEQLLFESIPRANTNEIGHRLIQRFGSVMDVLFAPREELVQVEGVGERSADWLIEARCRIGDMILAQAAEWGKLTEMDLSVIASWQMYRIPGDWVGVILCDELGSFRQFGYLVQDGAEPDCTGDPVSLAERISESGEASYFLLLPEDSAMGRDEVERTGTETARTGVFLLGAYRVRGLELEPVLIPEPDSPRE